MDYKVFSYHLEGREWILDGSEIHHDCATSAKHWRGWLAFDKSIGAKSIMFLRGETCIKFQSISPDRQNKCVWQLIEE